MASNPEQVRLTVLTKLQEALDEEAILKEQILALMHRFADRFTDRRVEINNMMKSRIKRYIDTKPNHELIHYCLENPPYELDWKDKEVPTSEGSLVTRTERVNETYKNVLQDIRDQLNAEVEADGESLESYYLRFYKMMNELIRNQCKVTNHQVNVQFLLQLQPEWQRSQQAATRNRGKATVNTPQPIYDQEPSMVDEDDETSKDKEIDKLMALISLSNAGYENQRNSNVDGARENLGSSVMQKSGIQCYNCKEFGHVARECQKPKKAKDAAYHREKMLLCKQEEAGI
nr:hypothetical protein [Tanacetum cinerariifolium]